MRFPSQTVKGETVWITRKEAVANVGMFLYSEDGRVFKRAHNSIEIEEVKNLDDDLPGEELDPAPVFSADNLVVEDLTVVELDFDPAFELQPGDAGTDEAYPVDPSAD